MHVRRAGVTTERVPHSLRLAAAIAWRFLVVAAAVVVVALALVKLRVVVLPVVVSLFLAAALAPVSSWQRRRGVPRTLAALAVLVATFALLAAVAALLAPRVVGELGEVGSALSGGVATVSNWLLEGPLDLSREELDRWRERAFDELRERAGNIVGGVLGGAYLAVEVAAGVVLTVFVLFFFLRDGDRIWRWAVGLFPSRARSDVVEVGEIAWETLGRYLRGIAVVAFVDALFIGLALWLIGVPLVLPLAVLTFFGGFFPIVGAVTAGTVAALVALVSNGLTAALLVVGAVILVQQLEGNVLQPFIVGRAVQLHPLAVLLGVTAGAVMWGVAGAFLAVPFVAVAAQAASHLGSDGGNVAAVAAGQLTKEELARLLREAERAHGEYERTLGQRDEDWPSWYAQFILEKLREREAGPGP